MMGTKTWEINELSGYNSSKSILPQIIEYLANGTYDDFILPSVDFKYTN